MVYRADDAPEDIPRVERMRIVGETEHLTIDVLLHAAAKWGKVIAGIVAGGAALVSLVVWLRAPGQNVEQVRVVTEALATRVGQMEQSRAETNERLSNLERNAEFQLYLTCTLLRTVDPNAVPRECSNTTPSGGRTR